MNRLLFATCSVFLAHQLCAKTACEILPIDDAVVVLSQNAQQRDLGTMGCLYEIQTPYLLLKVNAPQNAAASKFQQVKQAARDSGAQVHEEPGIGSDAFSVVSKSREEIYVIQGETAFSISLTNPGSSTPLPDLMDKMRKVIRLAVTRL